jgi:hypothetical protein
MSDPRIYHEFIHREAVFRICCEATDAVKDEIVRQRATLEAYIARQPEFKTSLHPIALLPEAPEIACRMATAAQMLEVGPMAAVAGAMAQCAAEAGLAAGSDEVIVDNGGDVYLRINRPLIVGLYPGSGLRAGRLGFSIQPDQTPVSICSSSGRMGHSMSMGQCDLATVVSQNAALADAAATQAANRVHAVDDIDAALNGIYAIDGIDGILIVKDGHIGMAGHLPRLVKIE